MLVGVALSDMMVDGMGQLGVLPRAHHTLASVFKAQRCETRVFLAQLLYRKLSIYLGRHWTNIRKRWGKTVLCSAAGGPLGPGGPCGWEREDTTAPNGHGVQYYPPILREAHSRNGGKARTGSDGRVWPEPELVKLRRGDAVIVLHGLPHSSTRNGKKTKGLSTLDFYSL